ncbi:MAG: glycosyltransferase family 4 protein [Chloroflexales bacterium]|nr:glycosyltransferase family 4 protein [Chloroflexales bacterium]
MRIGLDARYASDHFPGIGRSIVGLVRALAELGHGHTLVLIVDPRAGGGRYDIGALTRLPGVEVARLAASPFGLAQQTAVPALARRLRLDLLHSPYFVKPYLGLPCPSVVTVYDLIGWRFPRTLSWRGRLFYRASMALAVRTAAAIITISESARADLAHIYGLPAERLAVTPLAVERRFRPRPAEEVEAARARHGLPERYVLYVGSNKPHKNLERLARAWERVLAEGAAGGATLVIAGHEDRKHPELRRFVAERGLGATVRFLPNVDDSDLPALYSGATVFAFPSYYEGFGLPPLEAMACGAPVLCAYASSLPEVVGPAALTVDPFSMIEMAEGLVRLLHNPSLRRELSARGQRRAREFSWRRTALGTLRLYERVMG